MVQESKKITLGLVLSWIFGFLFLINGVISFFIGSIIAGISIILAALIILPPVNKFIKEKWNMELSRGIKITLVIVLIIIYVVSMPDYTQDSESSQSTNSPTTQVVKEDVNKDQESQPEVYKFGDRIKIGDFAYTFNDYTVQDYVGEGYITEEADGIFLILDVTIENIAKESKTLYGSYVTIVDDQGRRFEHDTTAEIYVDKSFSFEQMQPGLPKTGKIIFDVPQNIKAYIEISSDNVWSDEKKYVSIA